jgi:hypothetical protein
MSLAIYLKLAGADSPHYVEAPDYDDLGSADMADALSHLDHLNYGDRAGFWRSAVDDELPYERFAGDPGYWSSIHDEYGGLDAGRVEEFARLVLRRVETTPPGLSPATGDLTCLLSATGGQWGVYGVGVLNPPALTAGARLYQEDLGPNRLELALDPAWLDHDFRSLRSRQPWLNAGEAEWAVEHFRNVFNIAIPPTAVLRASLPPVPYGPASGDPVYWPYVSGPVTPEEGTLGPAVSYTDGAATPQKASSPQVMSLSPRDRTKSTCATAPARSSPCRSTGPAFPAASAHSSASTSMARSTGR